MMWHDQSALTDLLDEAQLDHSFYLPLLTIQSLTKGLEGLNPAFSVDLLHLGNVTRDDHQFFSRQVALKLQDMPVIVAESLCESESAFWQDYLNCGTSSLGRRLFNGENPIERSIFHYALMKGSDLPAFATSYCEPNARIIARRSIFQKEKEALSLIEYYLPALLHFAKVT